jgi:hypothetical protein
MEARITYPRSPIRCAANPEIEWGEPEDDDDEEDYEDE